MTYCKANTGKALSEQQLKNHCKSLGKDNVGVQLRGTRYQLNISRAYSEMYYGEPQKRLATGLSALDGNGKLDKANSDTVGAMVARMHNDLANGHFDKTLVTYGLGDKPQLEVLDGGKKPELSILEIYDLYCESRKGDMAETTLKLQLQGKYRHSIVTAINKAGNNPLDIYNYLTSNRSPKTTKECLRHLGKAYELGIIHKGLTENPFKNMFKQIELPSGKKKNQNNFDNEDSDEDNRAFSLDEMNIIIEAFESSGCRRHLAPIVKFLFWTGCRTGEAVGLKWRDIKWDKELITIRRTYNHTLKLFKPTKTKTIRFFPMPKNGKLWNLLKSIPERDSDNIIFESRNGNPIDADCLSQVWRGCRSSKNPGVIPELIRQGKVREYLKLYATRHTFVSIEHHVYGTKLTSIAQWVGNAAMVSYDKYLERDKITLPGNSGAPTPNNTQSSEFDKLLANLTPEQIEQLKTKLLS